MKPQLIQEAQRFQKLAGLIKENEITNTPVIQSLEKKAFDFFNQPKVVALLKKELDKLSPKKKAELANTSIQEGEANDFSSFKSTVEKVIDDASLNEEYDDMHDLLRGKIGGYEPGEEPTSVDKTVGNILTTLGVTNIMSMGFIPALTAMAIDEFGGTNIINTVSQAIGSGSVAAGLSVLGGIIGGGILWKIGKILKNEKTTGDTPLFEIESTVNKALAKFRLKESQLNDKEAIEKKVFQAANTAAFDNAMEKMWKQLSDSEKKKLAQSLNSLNEEIGSDFSSYKKIVDKIEQKSDLNEADNTEYPPNYGDTPIKGIGSTPKYQLSNFEKSDTENNTKWERPKLLKAVGDIVAGIGSINSALVGIPGALLIAALTGGAGIGGQLGTLAVSAVAGAILWWLGDKISGEESSISL
jgi:hypothetical protein